MDSRIRGYQWAIRMAIQSIHREYAKNPWIFMQEGDVQCALYAELMQQRCMKAKKTIVRDKKDKILKSPKYDLLTRPLHSELSAQGWGKGEYVDLCIIDPSRVEFVAKPSIYNYMSKDVAVHDWEWDPKDSIGIEIKFNRWRRKKTSLNRKTNRRCMTGVWRSVELGLIKDLKKLKKYKRGWLVFVDHHSMIKNYAEWREFVNDIIRCSNYGRLKKTLNAYYLCPKLKKALSYKSPRTKF